MIVGDVRREELDGLVRVSAAVEWETLERQPQTLLFETPSEFSAALSESAAAFAVACFLPAWQGGERRISLPACLDPRLAEGLAAAAALMREWRMFATPSPVIESRSPRRTPARPGEEAAILATGGVDSLYSIRQNRLRFPPDHPASFRAAIYLTGVPYDPGPGTARSLEIARRGLSALSAIGKEASLDVIPVGSNLRALEPDPAMYMQKSWGADNIAAAHALTVRFRAATVSSGFHLPDVLLPHPSHPFLDPLFSSAGLQIAHDGFLVSRLEKVAALAAWGTAIENLQVCFHSPVATDRPNCGACEKCVRTRLELLAVGALDRASSFPPGAIEAGQILALPPIPADMAFFWSPLVPRIRSSGRPDLASAIETKLAESRRIADWFADRGWKGRLRRLRRRIRRDP